jgi:hypothetical protein
VAASEFCDVPLSLSSQSRLPIGPQHGLLLGIEGLD